MKVREIKFILYLSI